MSEANAGADEVSSISLVHEYCREELLRIANANANKDSSKDNKQGQGVKVRLRLHFVDAVGNAGVRAPPVPIWAGNLITLQNINFILVC